MKPTLNVHPLLFALFVAPLALPAPALADEPDTGDQDPQDPEDEEDADLLQKSEERDDRLSGDLHSPFFAIGGGVGALMNPLKHKPEELGRFQLEVGFYVPMLYVSGGLQISGTESIPLFLDGFVAAGVAVPVPVFHPLIGFKLGAGGHKTSHPGWGEQVVFGPQIGWILRPYDKQIGVKAMVEALVIHIPNAHDSMQQVNFTLSFVM